MPLQVLHTEHATLARPVVVIIDRLRREHDDQLVVLVPVVQPDRLRYRLLHDHLDRVLSSALAERDDLVVARAITHVRSTAPPEGPPTGDDT